MTTGYVTGINGNLITAEVDGQVSLGEVVYVYTANVKLKAEIIRIKKPQVEVQTFDLTGGVRVGDKVECCGELLSVQVGPGLLGKIFDGLQNPLPDLAEQYGFFLPRGIYLPPLDEERLWDFTPKAEKDQELIAGDVIGEVPEGDFSHKIMLPFYFSGVHKLVSIKEAGKYSITANIAVVSSPDGKKHNLTMSFKWPVKRPITAYAERLRPSEPLVTKIRIIDSLLPIAQGGTYCIPGPFGAGKTVLQHITSRNAEVDIVIITACGERAGEVVEVLREFPKLNDPRTGRTLMERTVIICNTSSMPVAAREASVYTGVTIAEYYRQMGLKVLLLADSTSRWAQAMREVSGRLEEIPGEEAFPAYLESVIAGFYERAGRVRLNDGTIGAVTIGGTVSPAGGNFEEPVTQATLKVVGAFHGLSRDRAEARKYPSIHPLESWSRYSGIIDSKMRDDLLQVLQRGNEVGQMMKVVGEEGTTLDDYSLYLKSEFADAVYLQQNAFDPVDQSVSEERQKHVFALLRKIMNAKLNIASKEEMRSFFNRLRQRFIDYNGQEWKSDQFKKLELEMLSILDKVSKESISNKG